MSTVLMSFASAHHQGRSSTVMCRCPIRGDVWTAAAPNTGTMRKFSTRYWAQKTPRASPSGSGGSTTSFGAGSFSIATYGEAPRMSLALWAKAVVASTVPAAITARVLRRIVIAVSPFDGRTPRLLPWREVPAALSPFGLHQRDREIYVPASGARIGAQLMGTVHQPLCGCAVNAREADLEPCGDVILAIRSAEVHLGV